MLALNCGNTFRAVAITLTRIAVTVSLPPAASARGPKRLRSRSSSVMSALSCWVTAGTDCHAAVRWVAVVRRTAFIAVRSIGPHWAKSGSSGAVGSAPAAGACSSRLAVALTSSRRIRPPGPVPDTASMSTPISRARRRTAGVAGIGRALDRSPAAGAAGVAGCGGVAGCSGGGGCSGADAAPESGPAGGAAGSRLAIVSPTLMVSPAFTWIAATTPASGAGTSITALSVSNSSSGASFST